MEHGIFSVKSYGAVGDGIHKDTKAIQKAIDECAVAGGGRVLVSGGVFLTGTLYLRDNTDLHIAAGATLLGSPDREDYNADDAFPESRPFSQEQVTAAHLIVAYRISNISISGTGAINGNSSVFFEDLPPYENDHSYRAPKNFFKIKDWRPGQMVWFCRCENIMVKDVTLRDSTYWTLLMLGCQNAHVSGLTITNPPQTPNGDGIDIDCSRNVTISDCRIFVGDDCVTLRADQDILGEEATCENVVVSNCVLSSPANCLRVGVGDGVIRNCMFTNLIFVESRVGINIISRFPRFRERGVLIENISFSNITIDAILAIQALHGKTAHPERGMKHITFHDLRANVTAGAYISGNSDGNAEDISFRDCDFYVQDEALFPEFVDRVRFPDPIDGCDGEDGERALPAALYGRHIDGLQVRNVRVRFDENLTRTWLNALWFESCENVEGVEKVVK
jgi:polygalacturonase